MRVSVARFAGSFPNYRLAPGKELPQIAVGGRSNVGKSSLINSLVGRRNLAQVSKGPGKTRNLNFFCLSGKGGKPIFYLVDLPGFGFARVSIAERKSWKEMVDDYIENSPNLKGFVLLIDSRRGVQEQEIQLAEYLNSQGMKFCPVLTKSDKTTKSDGMNLLKETMGLLSSGGAEKINPILHSSINRTGNDLIWRWIVERIRDED